MFFDSIQLKHFKLVLIYKVLSLLNEKILAITVTPIHKLFSSE